MRVRVSEGVSLRVRPALSVESLDREFVSRRLAGRTLLGTQVDELLDAKFVLVPCVQLIKVLYDEGLSLLQTFCEPLGKWHRTAIEGAVPVQVEDARARKGNKRPP